MKKLFLSAITLFVLFAASAQTAGTKYALVVSFHSECCGVPSAKPLELYVAKFKKQYRIKKITYDRIGPLGREGEYDMAFKLKELTKKQTAVFIKNVKTVVKTMKDKGSADTEENTNVDAGGRAVPEKMSL